MDALPALLVIAGLLAAATLLGLLVRSRSTRVAEGCGGDEHQLAVEGAEVTLVQLSSPVCSACAAMRRVAESLVAADPTVAHREIDVVDEPGWPVGTRSTRRRRPSCSTARGTCARG